MFKARQRRTVQFFRRYVLSEQDIDPDRHEEEYFSQYQFPITQIWGELEPVSSEWDRRLLFEVTGQRLDDSEYRGDETSDEDEGTDKKKWTSLFQSKVA